MHPFSLESPRDLTAAFASGAQAGRNDAPAEFIAGGTDMVQLLQEQVRQPKRLVRLAGLLDNRIQMGPQGLRLGAAATMGGNLMQRTRCPYFRDVGYSAFNKRI